MDISGRNYRRLVKRMKKLKKSRQQGNWPGGRWGEDSKEKMENGKYLHR
jgi:hypothetical protein